MGTVTRRSTSGSYGDKRVTTQDRIQGRIDRDDQWSVLSVHTEQDGGVTVWAIKKRSIWRC
jgi:hypothetical protein